MNSTIGGMVSIRQNCTNAKAENGNQVVYGDYCVVKFLSENDTLDASYCNL